MASSYWYLSPAADAAIDAVMRADGRRTWDPRHDRPSLATLQGRARAYGGRYARSRSRLLARAGVVVSERCGVHGRRLWVVTMPGEPLSAAGWDHA